MKTECSSHELKSVISALAAAAILFGQTAGALADQPYWAQGNNGNGKHHHKHYYDDGEHGERGDDDHDGRNYNPGGYVVYQPVPVYPQPVYYGGNLLRCRGSLAGAAIGGATGAVIGSEIGHGDGKVAVIAGGAILGVLLGAAVGRAIDDGDRACAGNAVAYGPVGQPVYWENSGAGIAYRIVPVRQYLAYGLPCREYTAKAKIGGRNQRVTGTACRQPDGSWRVVG